MDIMELFTKINLPVRCAVKINAIINYNAKIVWPDSVEVNVIFACAVKQLRVFMESVL